MATISVILVLLVAVVASGVIARALPAALPRPLVQIALGSLIGLAVDWRVTLEPEIFFLLFLPPMLFLDGWRIPREDILKDRATIAELALGLVLFTVVGMGLFIHWMIPVMPLAVAFALAAVISPTDPIAVAAIARRVPIPSRMKHILEGESLLNDASGLVCLRFAVAAMLTGSFSPGDAALAFVWIALGGLAIGAGLTWTVGRAKAWVARHLGEDSGSQILISLLLPFGAYLLAERLHCSGILAAVAAGLTMGLVETGGQATATTRIRRNTVWDVVQFTLNGTIFVLLGEQLPAILARASETVRLAGRHEPWWLAVFVLAITLALALMRFLWVWASFRRTLFRRRGDGASADWRIIAAMSCAGVRGAVTLAGVLTLPLTLYDGSPFPARDLAIFLAMGVIIVSLVLASLALPWLLKGLALPPRIERLPAEEAARIASARAAIAALEHGRRERAALEDCDLHVLATARIIGDYRAAIASRQGDARDKAAQRRAERIERALRLAALRAERAEIFRMVRRRELDSEPARKLVRELDLLETRYMG